MNSIIQVRMAVYETCTHTQQRHTFRRGAKIMVYTATKEGPPVTTALRWTQIVHRSTRVEDDNRQITTALRWRSRHALITTPISFGSQYTTHTSYNQATQQSLVKRAGAA